MSEYLLTKPLLEGKLDAKNFTHYCSYFHNGDGHAFAQIGKRWQVRVSES